LYTMCKNLNTNRAAYRVTTNTILRSSFRASWINSKKVPKRWHSCTVFYYFLQVALHVSGETVTHHQELN
jgi:hypothetical protein